MAEPIAPSLMAISNPKTCAHRLRRQMSNCDAGTWTTNLIESPHSGVRRRTHNVSRWRDSAMVERWVASAWLLTEKHFRRIDGHANLWALAAILGRKTETSKKEKVA